MRTETDRTRVEVSVDFYTLEKYKELQPRLSGSKESMSSLPVLP